MDTNQYLTTYFPNLKLQKPLFYQWKYGIRFEVGSPSIPTMIDRDKGILNLVYFKQALDRAIQLFEYVFDPEDDIIMVCQRYVANRQKIKKRNFCLSSVKELKSKRIESSQLRNLYIEERYETKKEHWHRISVHAKTKEINYQKILKKLTFYDFSSYSTEVYFINKNQNLIFNLYDDRGLDIIATEKESLRNLYQEYYEWILEYDKKTIELLLK